MRTQGESCDRWHLTAVSDCPTARARADIGREREREREIKASSRSDRPRASCRKKKSPPALPLLFFLLGRTHRDLHRSGRQPTTCNDHRLGMESCMQEAEQRPGLEEEREGRVGQAGTRAGNPRTCPNPTQT